jgi:exopolyphosphatase / guanosine-5'-triphosphate,3'-diphosphate pyrophosphatase
MSRYAAIDIGSNSVRMEVAEVTPPANGSTGGAMPAIRILASERQVTRLGASVFRTGSVSAEAMDFVSTALAGMAQTYKRLEPVAIRAVATSAVRDARNQQEFLVRASAAAGTPVEIISGQEEARLIHLGVQSRWPHPKQRVLMIDIGGGSAELILSESGRIVLAVSKQLGALRLSELFLRTEPPKESELHRMDEYIGERLASAVRRIGTLPIDRVIATSATASAVVCAVNQVPRAKRDSSDKLRASTAQIRALYADLCSRTLEERRKIVGIGPRRAEIIVPGAAVLLRVLRELSLPSLYYSAGGVRDGIITDLAQRTTGRGATQMSRDQRDTVEGMAVRYGVSMKHIRKVAKMAGDLFMALEPLHKVPLSFGRLLEAAAHLHDIGHFISDNRHHKHSFYIVLNSDMPGFTERERQVIANLCRYHRKAPPSAEHSNWQPLDAEERRAVTMLSPLLRIADNLDRSRGQRVKSLECTIRISEVVIKLHANRDIDLEAWAAERAGEFFQQVYNRPIVVSRVRV